MGVHLPWPSWMAVVLLAAAGCCIAERVGPGVEPSLGGGDGHPTAWVDVEGGSGPAAAVAFAAGRPPRWLQSVATCDLVCAAGKYRTPDCVCAPCPAGSFCTRGQADTLWPCSSGTFSVEGASACTQCRAGTVPNPASTACDCCAPGTFAASGASRCTPCPLGNVTSGVCAGSCGCVGPWAGGRVRGDGGLGVGAGRFVELAQAGPCVGMGGRRPRHPSQPPRPTPPRP